MKPDDKLKLEMKKKDIKLKKLGEQSKKDLVRFLDETEKLKEEEKKKTQMMTELSRMQVERVAIEVPRVNYMNLSEQQKKEKL